MRRFVLTFLGLLCSAAAHGEDARGLAAACAGCHGAAGGARAGNHSLTGMPKDEIARAMRAFRSGERAGTLMPQLAKGYTDAEVDAIAGWYATRPSTP